MESYSTITYSSKLTVLSQLSCFCCMKWDILTTQGVCFQQNDLSEVTLSLSIVTLLSMDPCWVAPLIRHPQSLYMVERQVEATAFLIGCLNATFSVLFVCQGDCGCKGKAQRASVSLWLGLITAQLAIALGSYIAVVLEIGISQFFCINANILALCLHHAP